MSEKYTSRLDHGSPSGRACADLTGVYEPIPENQAASGVAFAVYQLLHDDFGRDANDVMHPLRAVRREAMAKQQPRSLTPATQEGQA